MKVGTKLNYAFIFIIIIILISTATSYLNLTGIQDKSNEALDYRLKQIILVEDIRYNLAMEDVYTRALVMDPDNESNKTELIEYSNNVDGKIKEMEQLVSAPEMVQYLSNLIEVRNTYKQTEQQLFNVIKMNDFEKANSIIVNEMNKHNDGILKATDSMVQFQNKQMDEISEETQASVARAKTISIIALVITVILGIVLMVLVQKLISKPLVRVMNSAKHIAEGNLTEENLTMTAKDEIGQLGQIFDNMKTTLNNLIRSIQTNAAQLSASAEELSASTEEVNASSTEVARQLTYAANVSIRSTEASEESALAMEKTAQGVHRIAVASQQLHHSSIDTAKVSNDGKMKIETAKKQMDIIHLSTTAVNKVVQKLSKQTEEIQNITNAITAITEQTNLLSLNASIEAARAGEHGKGFAVVANEVKLLAEQSKESANSIGELTCEIQNDTQEVLLAVKDAIVSVSDGVEIITEAGNSFDHILTAVDKMSIQIEEVSSTAEQLSASAQQVSSSITEIATSSKASSEQLSTLSQAMDEQVSTMHEVSNVAISLTESATSLQSETLRFKVK